MRIHKAAAKASVLLIGLGCILAVPDATLRAQDGTKEKETVRYQVDGSWPKRLPPNWTVQGITGMFVDKNDHIWVLNRPRDLDKGENFALLNPPTAECCVQPPAVLEFDVDGNLLRSWGVPDSVPGWPRSEHTIFTDRAGNVWIAGATAGDTLMKFTADGKFISDFGHRGPKLSPEETAKQKEDNQQTSLLLRGVAGAELDEDAHEIYIADGYLNKRVIVYDLDTGAFKRGWGAYGVALDQIDNEPLPPRTPGDPLAKQFRQPVHCVHLSKDGLVYVCDRGGDRIQVFTKQGKFVKEFPVSNSSGSGTVGSIDFSPDPQQKYLFVSSIMDSRVWILNRNDGSVAGRFGHLGHEPGDFRTLHVATADSHGNIYTGEVTTGERIQKFVPVK
jgi:hypothetical protein